MKNMIMKKKINPWWFVPLALVAGLVAGIVFFGGNDKQDEHDHLTETQEGTTYTCSMHPQIRQDEPGQCPICGMDLVPVSEATDSGDSVAVQLSGSAIRLGNVETLQVGFSGTPDEMLTLNGRVVADENEIRSQSTHVSGRIERLFVNTVGEEVRRGQRIATLYSPALIAAQQELLQAAEMAERQPQLLDAAKEKLRSFRLSNTQINEILSTRSTRNTMDIFAEWAGTVLEKKVNVGDHVNEGDVLYVVSDLSSVWVEFDAYESDLPLISLGDVIRFTVSGIPGKTFQGKVSFIDPVVNPRTRVARIRVEMDNPGQRLKPQMFVKGSLQTGGVTEDRLIIPRSAVLWTGPRSVVYEKTGSAEGSGASFRIREVVLGPSVGDYYVVESGLAPGAEIVVNGTFTVDAAAQLAGKPSMMNSDQERDEAAGLATPPASFRTAVASLIRSYTNLKDYLVNSDFEKASDQVETLKDLLENIPEQDLSEAWLNWWNPVLRDLQTELAQAEDAENIDALRSVFISLSETMVTTGKTVSPFDESLFVMRCPMANNNQGARWLSLEEEVMNPYYGDMMLNCGSITETIE